MGKVESNTVPGAGVLDLATLFEIRRVDAKDDLGAAPLDRLDVHHEVGVLLHRSGERVEGGGQEEMRGDDRWLNHEQRVRK